MTKFHVTLDGKPQESSQLRSELQNRLGTKLPIRKSSKPTNWRPPSSDKWQHDLFDELEQSPSRGEEPVEANLRSQGRIRRGPSFGSIGIQSRLGFNRALASPTKQRPRLFPSTPALTADAPRVHRAQALRMMVEKDPVATTSDMDDLLISLGLEKYMSFFKAEEVDLDALRCLSEQDMQALGIPMGPRKKILAALT
mmetsp:Transcript_11379/g.15501  ORF Transcript_11379/g.15501 Transcript_11379/m.15501 type:complete len:197 (-) Transcript_11379:279-869(-)|eukprot:CAMPEP_0196585960 /NCGR_PEP_ID=MMETSP1081-20130531/52694_1 /TAXON_ID=36882 /ORGANISM="Pyramimonas amylifera, Strain CCMP720" /LENGTH=196 /DNA_ID=CAMNT_0041907681 /DNA_START=116 /DNA_END=706 /DNA_ORIENTATION=-